MIQRKTLSRRVTAESTSAASKSVMKTLQNQQTFPFKLYEMLEYACDSEFADSFFWSADGSVFIIHNKDVMMDDLAPMFFKQTKFRSFTRQLNIWGFVRTETLGGEKGGWLHENFRHGRPDLLKRIERTEVKGASKKSSSITKPQASSRSARRPAKNVNEVNDDNSCSSSQAESQTSLCSHKDAQVQNNDTAAFAPPVSQAYFDHIPVSSEDSVSLSSSSVHTCSDDTSAQGANTQQVEEMYSVVQPFNSDDLMYLASIFEKDDQSNGDLSSILSLNQEASIEDYSFNL
mmetsp:Transcript_24949/g.39180  ORF Transcript_24949/g.39180 Transcript_24949/m.39180 type:complete len:289 (-) Transcript_24949:148-1014(-)